MKKIILFSLLILPVIQGWSQAKAEKKLATSIEDLRNAMVKADSIQLNKLVSDKLSYGHSSGQIDDKEMFIRKIITGKSDFVTLEFREQSISIHKNIAIVRHKLNAVTNDNGKPGEVHLNVLLVWQKRYGNWKLLARQAVKIQ